MVESLDESVGRVLKKLDDLKLADNTIVIFTSDNGGLATSEGSPTSNCPLRTGKGWLYEGGIRVPLIVRWPGVSKPGAVSPRAGDQHRLLPDPPRIAGQAPRPPTAPRRRQPRAAAQGSHAPGAPLFWHYPHYSNQGGAPCGAVRLGDLKLIEWFEDDRVELYDLRDDPGETPTSPPIGPRSRPHSARGSATGKPP